MDPNLEPRCYINILESVQCNGGFESKGVDILPQIPLWISFPTPLNQPIRQFEHHLLDRLVTYLQSK